MSSKLFTKLSSFIFPRNSIIKRYPVRLNTTGPTPPPTPASTPPNPSTMPKTPAEKGKGKGPITWKSLGVVLVGGAGLMVNYNFNIRYSMKIDS